MFYGRLIVICDFKNQALCDSRFGAEKGRVWFAILPLSALPKEGSAQARLFA